MLRPALEPTRRQGVTFHPSLTTSGFYNWAANGNKDIVSSQVGSYRVEFSGAIRSSGLPSPATNTAEANWAVIASYATKRF